MKTFINPPPGFKSKLVTPAIPKSSAISIMKGEGLKRNNDEGLSESSVLPISPKTLPELREEQEENKATPSTLCPYKSLEVSQICDNLNIQNRRAKHSSMACQKLFLSLFFKNNVEIAKAVVTDLRVNGLIVFVPKFDMKGYVYLRDINGDVQMDPSAVGLDVTSGLDPTLGFAACENYRRFPDGKVTLVDNNVDNSEWSLQVSLPAASRKLEFRILDVITVRISCDMKEIKARIPAPRLYMLSSKVHSRSEATRTKEGIQHANSTSSTNLEEDMKIKSVLSNSMYQQLAAVRISAILPVETMFSRRKKVDFESTVAGRKIFAAFVNPDTRSSQQEAAVVSAAESAAKRRTMANQAQGKNSEFSTSQAIERAVTARTQRLAASKRNSKKSKAK